MKLAIQPQIVEWALQNSDLTADALAEKLNFDSERWGEFQEQGFVTYGQAKKIARLTKIPIGFLFLSTPPEEKLPISDFRTVGNNQFRKPSRDLLDVIFDAQRKQDWYRDYLIYTGHEPPNFVGALRVDEDVIEAASKIRDRMKMHPPISGSWEDNLKRQFENLEEQGIVVTRSGTVGSNSFRPLNVSEFRGFALSDQYAPLIFINGSDTKAAQFFTLAHELVHIWLGDSGITNFSENSLTTNRIESFCNQVAAELLVPHNRLVQMWATTTLEKLSLKFRVSSLVILIKALNSKLISYAEFVRLYREKSAFFQSRESRGRSGGGGNYYATQEWRVGRNFARAVVTSSAEGRTLQRDAMRLLGTKKAETYTRFAEGVTTL